MGKFSLKNEVFFRIEITNERTQHHTQLILSLCIAANSTRLGKSVVERFYHLPENQDNRKTNSSMNMKVGDIIQYYTCKILDVLD